MTNLPALEEPTRYRGLYVFDFGEWAAVGYTAEEVAILLDSERYTGGKVYKIHRAAPDGQIELRGVAPTRFQLESGLMFNRAERAAAVEDFNALRALANRVAAPCRAFVHLIDRGADAEPASVRYVTALIYPAEYEDEIARWLLAESYQGGDTVEGGPSHVTNYYEDAATILQRDQLWSRPAVAPRPADEVLACVHEAIQR